VTHVRGSVLDPNGAGREQIEAQVALHQRLLVAPPGDSQMIARRDRG
jgi:hypothetical protein